LNFNKQVVNILFAKRPGREDELVGSSDSKAGFLSQAVYRRNTLVEENYGVKMEMIPDPDDTVAEKFRLDVQGGTGDYDIIADGTYRAIIPVIEGLYQNLNESTYVDTDKHYWTQGYNDMVTFTEDEKQYLVTGSAAISLFRYMFLTIYNKEMFNARGIPDLYDTVKAGKWTLDYQFDITTGLHNEMDGDGNNSAGDFHGFVTGDTISVDPYLVASDIHLLIKDESTDYQLAFNLGAKDALFNLCNKVQKLYNSGAVYVFKG